MDFKTFKRILTSFADTPASIDAAKGKLICEIRNEMIEADLVSKEGELWVREHEVETRATSWLLSHHCRI